MFNITNSVRFDAHSISVALDNPQNFGQATVLLTNKRLASSRRASISKLNPRRIDLERDFLHEKEDQTSTTQMSLDTA